MVEVIAGVAGSAFVGFVAAGLKWASKTNERVSVVEAKQDTHDEWLARVEGKLDRAIEQRRR